jgi:uncharacterized membrane protein
MRTRDPGKFFTKEEKERIVQAIRNVEKQTSGEIRVFLERKEKADFMDSAKKIFQRLGMTKTEKRNGVLIYFSLADHRFAVLGDKGIDQKVGGDFWKEEVRVMEEAFKKNDFVGGLEAGIKRVGEKLKTYFPFQDGDRNELSDRV